MVCLKLCLIFTLSETQPDNEITISDRFEGCAICIAHASYDCKMLTSKDASA